MNGQTEIFMSISSVVFDGDRHLTIMKFCLKSLGLNFQCVKNQFQTPSFGSGKLKKPRLSLSSPTSHYPSLFLPFCDPHTSVWPDPDVWCPLPRASFLLLDFSYSAFWQDHLTDLLIFFFFFFQNFSLQAFFFQCSVVYMQFFSKWTS